MTNLVKNTILGVGITNAKKEDILEYILSFLAHTQDSLYIVTPNPEILVYASTHDSFKTILNAAQISLADGVGVTLAGSLLGKSFKERISGTDFMDFVCQKVADQPVTVGFLGGRGGVAKRTAERLEKKYPGLNVVFVAEEWGSEGFDLTKKYQVSSIKYKEKTKKGLLNTEYLIPNTPSVDILFVAYGFPKQEEWMAAHVGKIPVRVMMSVGGAFDYVSGNVSRAPLLIRSIGFEWLFRLVVQPWRIKRQLALIHFVFLVLKEKIFRRA